MTKCDVKMARCWQSSVVCIFKGQDEVEDQRNAKKKQQNREQGLHPAILIEQAGQLRIRYFSKRFYLN